MKKDTYSESASDSASGDGLFSSEKWLSFFNKVHSGPLGDLRNIFKKISQIMLNYTLLDAEFNADSEYVSLFMKILWPK